LIAFGTADAAASGAASALEHIIEEESASANETIGTLAPEPAGDEQCDLGNDAVDLALLKPLRERIL